MRKASFLNENVTHCRELATLGCFYNTSIYCVLMQYYTLL